MGMVLNTMADCHRLYRLGTIFYFFRSEKSAKIPLFFYYIFVFLWKNSARDIVFI